MLEFSKTKVWTIVLVLALGVWFAIPNLFPERTVATWPDWAPKSQINLGLDLRGGSHILLEADAESLFETRLESLEDNLRVELRRADGGAIAIGDVSLRGDRLSVLVRDPARVDDAVEIARDLASPIGLSGSDDYDVEVIDGTRLVMTPTEVGKADAVNAAMLQAVEVIRKRIDELGTREPTIIRNGDDRIVVQVPGLQDPQALKALLGKTAKLEFKMVDLEATQEELGRGRAPPGSEVLIDDETDLPMAVKRRVIIAGDQLIDAQQTFQDGQPVVNFRFDSTGARRFARVTQENTGRPFAIILDDRIISAPRINEPILGGSGVISGNFTVEERQRTRHSAALGQIAGRTRRDRGADGRAGSGCRFDPRRFARQHPRRRRRDGVHVHHLWPVRLVFERRADAEPYHDRRHHERARRDADAAGHCRFRPDGRRGGRCERPDQRANPRRAAARPAYRAGDRTGL